MKARAPRLGERIMRDGVETLIVAFPLYQPAAPKFFEVTDSAGSRLFVQFVGEKWIEYRAPLTLKVDVESAKLLPAVALSPIPPVRLTRPSEPLVTVNGVSAAVKVLRGRRPRAELILRQAQDDKAGAKHVALHARLDAAREAYDRAREAGSDDRIVETMAPYVALIAEVDRIDPGFYLGRVNPLPPLRPGEAVQFKFCSSAAMSLGGREDEL